MAPRLQRLWRRRCKYEFHVPLTPGSGDSDSGCMEEGRQVREDTAHCLNSLLCQIPNDLQGRVVLHILNQGRPVLVFRAGSYSSRLLISLSPRT